MFDAINAGSIMMNHCFTGTVEGLTVETFHCEKWFVRVILRNSKVF